MAVKALACELPAASGRPLARWQCPDLARAAIEQGIVASISDTTIWRWLSAHAIKPWRMRSWIFPRYVELRIARTMPSSGLCAVGSPKRT